PPDHATAAVRRRLEAVLRRCGGVLVVAGDWDGAQARLLVTRQEGAGIAAGHGRLRGRRGGGGGGGRGGAAGVAGAGGVGAGAAGAGGLGGPGGPDRYGDAGHRVTAPGPARVLVVWCPDWPAPADPAAARAFERVVSLVEELCPRVEVLHPGACAIGARGPARYFGGEEALAGKIIETVTGGGFACQAGVADGLFAARLAARAAAPGSATVVPPGQAREFLAPYPVSVLDSEELTEL